MERCKIHRFRNEQQMEFIKRSMMYARREWNELITIVTVLNSNSLEINFIFRFAIAKVHTEFGWKRYRSIGKLRAVFGDGNVKCSNKVWKEVRFISTLKQMRQSLWCGKIHFDRVCECCEYRCFFFIVCTEWMCVYSRSSLTALTSMIGISHLATASNDEPFYYFR